MDQPPQPRNACGNIANASAMGSRRLVVELRETEIDALIKRGLLTAETRANSEAVVDAFHTFLDRTFTEAA